MNPLAYHVLLEGRRMGPYDRRTIVGLRIKKTLTSDHLLEASDGSRLSVAELLGRRPAPAEFNPMASGNYTAAKATCSAWLIERERGPIDIPAFRGEVEVRVHADVLRIAGKHRLAFALKDGRVKLPLADLVYFRTTGFRLDLWLRSGEGRRNAGTLQRIALDLFSAEAVQELLHWLPDSRPWPDPATAQRAAKAAPTAAVSPLLWVAVFGVVMVAGLVLLVLLRRRF